MFVGIFQSAKRIGKISVGSKLMWGLSWCQLFPNTQLSYFVVLMQTTIYNKGVFVSV